MRKHTQEFVENYFKEHGCILLDTYVDARKPMNYICECGEKSCISFDNFKKGKRCKQCGLNKLAEQFKHSYEYVYNYFSENNCILISTNYINDHTPLDYICECGNTSKIRFADFQQGKRCWICKNRKLGDRDRLDFEFIKIEFENAGYKLLSETYHNAHQKLKYICDNGEISFITYDKLKFGHRCECEKCTKKKWEKFKGENHWNYNPDKTDEERILERNYPEYNEWRSNVFIRDNYTCQCCGKTGGRLNAHHLNGYHWAIDERTDINNGKTLCDECHSEFHNQYGSTNNTKEQFEEYLKNANSNIQEEII
jgi:hypothetical protein